MKKTVKTPDDLRSEYDFASMTGGCVASMPTAIGKG